LALGINLIPDPRVAEHEHRIGLVRSIVTSVTTLAESNRSSDIQKVIDRNTKIEPKLISIGLRRDSKLLVASDRHEESWRPIDRAEICENQVAADILCRNQKWATLEIVFAPQNIGVGSWRLFSFPIPLIAFLAGSVALISWYTLGRTLRYLNPSRIVPDRVKSALDSIGSGLAMITPDGEIAHVNTAFGRIVHKSFEEVVGTTIDSYHWSLENDVSSDFPWNRTRRYRESIAGEIVQAKVTSGVVQKFMVSSTPIFGSENQFRGVLVSFEDVTALEAKKAELAKIIHTVRQSRDEVQRQNEQLHFLANYDALTRCMNRRSFYTEYESLWNRQLEHPLTVMILDIDYFKKINDNYGHSAGDEVLKSFGTLLTDVIGNQGMVCRYGGEEFTVVLPNLPFEECVLTAEKVRSAIEQEPIAGLKITTSIGISNRAFGAMDSQHMLDQADECLYAAKRNGRNQVVSYDRIHEYPVTEVNPSETVTQKPTDLAKAETLPAESRSKRTKSPDELEYSSITGLLSALSFRSRPTAEHSIRVADLAVDIGRSLLDEQDLYCLEIAALLHDVGKIGVPDSILNKPDRLTPDEWKIMRRHDDMGIAIVRSAFSSAAISDTLEQYYWIKENPTLKSRAEELSLAAQILYVCDAFDSMISGSVYRQGMDVAQALGEILNNTPHQFEPIVVNELVAFIQSGRLRRRKHGSEESASDNSSSTSWPSDIKFRSKNDQPAEKQTKDELDHLIDLADEVMTMHYQTRANFDTDSYVGRTDNLAPIESVTPDQ
jgi:diguanylate cyclase (GGDEF)-like protein/PAS domain S-box-containing protein